LATLDGPAYIERVALTDAKHHMRARKAVRKGLKNQMEGRGFSFVEFLSACPSNWKVSPKEAIHWVEKNMIPVFPLNVFRDEDRHDTTPLCLKRGTSSDRNISAEPAVQASAACGAIASGDLGGVSLKLSGFGGQGVLFSGLALAEGALREGLQVSWIPSYGPEMRGGTAHCHVRLSQDSIASPLINRPSSLMAFNQPSIDKFAGEVLPGGLLLVNASMVTHIPDRSDIQVVKVPAYEAAQELGNVKAANMVLLGAYIEITLIEK
ncbi:MAG: 2-oxoacid:acceptor oxidoreductase family protein, partial [Acidobacteriota bacterium]